MATTIMVAKEGEDVAAFVVVAAVVVGGAAAVAVVHLTTIKVKMVPLANRRRRGSFIFLRKCLKIQKRFLIPALHAV